MSVQNNSPTPAYVPAPIASTQNPNPAPATTGAAVAAATALSSSQPSATSPLIKKKRDSADKGDSRTVDLDRKDHKNENKRGTKIDLLGRDFFKDSKTNQTEARFKYELGLCKERLPAQQSEQPSNADFAILDEVKKLLGKLIANLVTIEVQLGLRDALDQEPNPNFAVTSSPIIKMLLANMECNNRPEYILGILRAMGLPIVVTELPPTGLPLLREAFLKAETATTGMHNGRGLSNGMAVCCEHPSKDSVSPSALRNMHEIAKSYGITLVDNPEVFAKWVSAHVSDTTHRASIIRDNASLKPEPNTLKFHLLAEMDLEWADDFDEVEIAKTFISQNGQTDDAPFIQRNGQFRLYEEDNLFLLQIPFKGNKFDAYFLGCPYPNQLEATVGKIKDLFDKWESVQATSQTNLCVRMPQLNFSVNSDVCEILKRRNYPLNDNGYKVDKFVQQINGKVNRDGARILTHTECRTQFLCTPGVRKLSTHHKVFTLDRTCVMLIVSRNEDGPPILQTAVLINSKTLAKPTISQPNLVQASLPMKVNFGEKLVEDDQEISQELTKDVVWGAMIQRLNDSHFLTNNRPRKLVSYTIVQHQTYGPAHTINLQFLNYTDFDIRLDENTKLMINGKRANFYFQNREICDEIMLAFPDRNNSRYIFFDNNNTFYCYRVHAGAILNEELLSFDPVTRMFYEAIPFNSIAPFKETNKRESSHWDIMIQKLKDHSLLKDEHSEYTLTAYEGPTTTRVDKKEEADSSLEEQEGALIQFLNYTKHAISIDAGRNLVINGKYPVIEGSPGRKVTLTAASCNYIFIEINHWIYCYDMDIGARPHDFITAINPHTGYYMNDLIPLEGFIAQLTEAIQKTVAGTIAASATTAAASTTASGVQATAAAAPSQTTPIATPIPPGGPKT